MRVLDILLSVVALVLFGPLLLGLAAIVRLTSPGPALYRARRVGRGGRPFTMYKFRTMYLDDGSTPRVTAGGADPRITPAGRLLRDFKLDELPQLLNVLVGQMALVGPRPEDPAFLPYYTAEERQVLAVRPGLTAPAQLLYRELAERYMRPDEDPTAFYLNDFLHRRLAMDLEYARTRTCWGDIRLVWRTLLHITRVRRMRIEDCGLPVAVDTLGHLDSASERAA